MSPPTEAPATAITIPRRNAQPIARSAKVCRHSAHATATAARVCAAIPRPITVKMAPFSRLLVLKWLDVPRAACRAMSATSTTNVHAVTAAARRASRGQSERKRSTQASVAL